MQVLGARAGRELGDVGQADQHQQQERDRGQQRVERQRAGEEQDVVPVRLMKGTAREAPRRLAGD